MKYRVILTVGYCDAYFDFNTIEGAGDFAKSILVHGVGCDDTKKKTSVRIEVINEKESEEE